MPQRKRTSAAEKLVILRKLIVEGKCSWNLKELEKHGTKAGIVTQAIKDTLQSLVDDNLVDFDKIGSGAFFWSFESKTQLRLENKVKSLTETLNQLNEHNKSSQAKLEALQESRKAPVSSDFNFFLSFFVLFRFAAPCVFVFRPLLCDMETKPIVGSW